MNFEGQDKRETSPQKTDPGSSLKSINQKQSDLKKQARKAIGNYTYHEDHIIGWGYTSKVYRGKTLEKNNPLRVAIKKIPITNLDNLHISLLQNEVRLVKKLNHPNVVKVYDILYTKKNCYIIMELCEEGSLEKHLNHIQTTDEKIKIISDVCAAFQYLVSIGVVHRDIKPGNILRSKTGQWKLADFGFATDIGQALKDDKISVGTPIYMAPQSLNIRKYSYKTDIFSMGIVFYQILHKGKLLWFQKNKKKILEAILNFDFEEVSVPSPFNRSFLLKMLQIEPESRVDPDKVCVSNLIKRESTVIRTEKQIGRLNYDQILRKDQKLVFYNLTADLINDDALLDYEDCGAELYSALKIQKDALQIELETCMAMEKRRSFSKIDIKPGKNLYVVSKVTNPFCIDFIHYLKELVDGVVSKVPISSPRNFYFKSSETVQLCYKKTEGRYILSPKNVSLSRLNIHLRENLLHYRNHLQMIINEHGMRFQAPSPELRKVMSQNYLHSVQF